MSLDPYRPLYRPPILSDLPPSVRSMLRAVPLRDALALAQSAPSYQARVLDAKTGRRYHRRASSLYLSTPEGLTPDCLAVRVLGERKARALAAEAGGVHLSAVGVRTLESAARMRQVFDLLDMGTPLARLTSRTGIGAKWAAGLAATLDMWRAGSAPEAIQLGAGCGPRSLALALCHELNRPGGVPAGAEEAGLAAPRLPDVDHLREPLPDLVRAIGMRDALTLTHVAESMGARVADTLADSLGVGGCQRLPYRHLLRVARDRQALDLLALGFAPAEVVRKTGMTGSALTNLRRGAAAWRDGAAIEDAARRGSMCPGTLALILWREW